MQVAPLPPDIAPPGSSARVSPSDSTATTVRLGDGEATGEVEDTQPTMSVVINESAMSGDNVTSLDNAVEGAPDDNDTESGGTLHESQSLANEGFVGFAAVASAPDAISTGSTSSDELPSYSAVASVRENVPNMTILLRQSGQPEIVVDVSDFDSISQLKSRICRVNGVREDASARMELRRTGGSHILDNHRSLIQLNIGDGTKLDLYNMSSDGKLVGPDDDGGLVVVSDPDTTEERITISAAGSATSAGASSPQQTVKTAVNDELDDEEAPPPEYSMIDRIRRIGGANRSAMGRSEYCARGFVASLAILIVLGLFVVLPTSLITIGAVNLDRCPERPSIPVWMIVFGTVWLNQAILERISARLRQKIEIELRRSPEYMVMPAARMRTVIEVEFSRKYRRIDQIDQLFQTFGFIWFVIGSVWVFGCSKCRTDYDDLLGTGCDEATYRFALVLIVILYVMLAMPFLAIMFYIFAVTFCRNNTM